MWGGAKKNRYWTGDGRAVWKSPSWVEDSAGNTRDRNLDKFYAQAPETLKPHCPHCGDWHDDEEGIEKCRQRADRSLKVGNKMLQKENDRIAELESRVKNTDEKLDKILKLLEKA